MNSLEEALDNPFFIHSVTFMENGFLIQYVDQAPHPNVIKTKMIEVVASTEQREDLYLNLQEMLRWLIDDADIEWQDSPTRLDADGRDIPNE